MTPKRQTPISSEWLVNLEQETQALEINTVGTQHYDGKRQRSKGSQLPRFMSLFQQVYQVADNSS